MKYAKKMRLIEITNENTQKVKYDFDDESKRKQEMETRTLKDDDFLEPHYLQILDGEMKKILDDATIMPPQKWILYRSILERYLGFVRRLRNVQSTDAPQIPEPLSTGEKTDGTGTRTPKKKLRRYSKTPSKAKKHNYETTTPPSTQSDNYDEGSDDCDDGNGHGETSIVNSFAAKLNGWVGSNITKK